ncbi:MAG TPA: twin-arginine translocase TatA/TatE family subunit [Myxococcaceae bacterium]|jgi:sec-independent protein translocase protein TatB|nr:twin-arginine translocase TatA/TatE family subunit [Myxococcaceae bacterium]
MFNLGAGEIAVIAVLALLLLGPERLPELARGLGRFFREFRRQTDEVRGMVEREFYRMDQDVLGEGGNSPAVPPLSRSRLTTGSSLLPPPTTPAFPTPEGVVPSPPPADHPAADAEPASPPPPPIASAAPAPDAAAPAAPLPDAPSGRDA